MKAVWYSFSLFLGLGLFYACSNASSSGSTESLSEAPVINEAAPVPVEEKEIRVKISTDYGDMVVKLYNETPQHRDNFVKLAREGFYNGTLFHRVLKGFMIQGGDPGSKNAKETTPLGGGGPGYTIPAEFNSKLIHKKGALSGARQPNEQNPQRRSSGSQFYIVQGRGGNPNIDTRLDQGEIKFNFKYTKEQREIYRKIGGASHLDMDYTVFGEVIEGLNIIDSIANVPVMMPYPGFQGRPKENVKMTISVLQDAKN